jgi:cell division transport system permease protein
MRRSMAALRALAYFFEEALQSLWRSRLIAALSVGTISVSLFVVGAFLALASSLSDVVERWTQKVQVTFYLEDSIEERIRKSLEDRLKEDLAVESVELVTRAMALERFKALFRDLSGLPDDLGQNPFPASLEVTLRGGHQSKEEVTRLVQAYETAPGVEEAQYDLLWIERLATAVRLVRGTGALLGGILVLAGVFTISNVIRLTIYAREDELDIMRLVGATQAYVKGPFVVEGMLQGGVGGAIAVALLTVCSRILALDAAAADELLGRTALAVSPSLILLLVLGGMAVGVAGSLLSLGRRKL